MFRQVFLSLLIITSFFASAHFTLASSQNNPPPPASGAKLDNPIKADSFPVVIGSVVSQVLGVVGALALLMFIFGGLTWMTAAGNEQKITQGKNILMWAAIGLFVIFSSYALVKLVLETIGAN